MPDTVTMPTVLAIALWAAVIVLFFALVQCEGRARQRRKAMRRQIEGLRAQADAMKWANER